MLGCGTSTGVPGIGNNWGACDPKEPLNRRSRSSILLENDAGARLLIDTSTDLRNQLLDNNIDRIDAVFWTHDHADHCHGIDDLRPFRYGRGGPLPGYASSETMQRLKRRFDYVFAGQYGYHTLVTGESLDNLRMCCGFGVQSCEMPHGPGFTTGFRFDYNGISICYLVDFSEITAGMIALSTDCDVLVVDCLRREPHPTHANLAMALDMAEKSRASKVILTHLDRSMDYISLCHEVPGHVIVGYDGLVMEV